MPLRGSGAEKQYVLKGTLNFVAINGAWEIDESADPVQPEREEKSNELDGSSITIRR